MRKGYTTGSCAAAAAKAATAILYRTLLQVDAPFPPETGFIIEIPLPYHGRLRLMAEMVEQDQESVTCQVIKDGGDDPDNTHGLAIEVKASVAAKGIHITGGQGVGRLTRPGLALPVGEAAINPIPQKMIREAVSEVLPKDKGVHLVVTVPEGEKKAPATLNPKLGITGGISILGTTGLVYPMSEEAFKHSLESQIDLALQAGHHTLLLTPGRMGQRTLEELGAPAEAIIVISNFIGHMLDQCRKKGVKQVLLWGHIGKLVKMAGGIFHSHSKIADGRREIMVAHGAIVGLPQPLLQRLLNANTAEEAVMVLEKAGEYTLLEHLANVAAQKGTERFQGPVEVVFTNLQGQALAWSDGAKKGSVGSWNIPLQSLELDQEQENT
ncbi:cobalt-precorrin-5B (C(1))-methyltransferase CbiD [Heliorestis convoluta]|uniref:Cobalt-precorrin-5B C(1)-methyltransferase n=1 Tax=Heliorestis convoluta TaxID=356322 RepID=A0A5Q2N2V1_9FIRM|nr:cobalt-precorrin-5B (C(1))-methyltransferase CbiD [Heliorestis convoluta]QGG46905.1 cobalt-precorrin-5B (C(1))-methyltransferase [Heliorestis convoluta]